MNCSQYKRRTLVRKKRAVQDGGWRKREVLRLRLVLMAGFRLCKKGADPPVVVLMRVESEVFAENHESPC